MPGLHTYLRYLLEEPPESQPSPVIRPPKKDNRKIAASTSKFAAVQGTLPYLTYLYLGIRAYNTAKKSHHSLNQKLLSARPTYLATCRSENTSPDLRQAYYKVNTHTSNLPIEFYSDSTSSTSEHSQAPLANLFNLSFTS